MTPAMKAPIMELLMAEEGMLDLGHLAHSQGQLLEGSLPLQSAEGRGSEETPRAPLVLLGP